MQIVEQQQEEQVMENMYEPGYTQHDLHKAQMSQHAGTATTSISIFQPLESVYIYKSSTNIDRDTEYTGTDNIHMDSRTRDHIYQTSDITYIDTGADTIPTVTGMIDSRVYTNTDNTHMGTGIRRIDTVYTNTRTRDGATEYSTNIVRPTPTYARLMIKPTPRRADDFLSADEAYAMLRRRTQLRTQRPSVYYSLARYTQLFENTDNVEKFCRHVCI